MMRLLGKMILLAAGVVHLGMVAAGRSVSLRGCDAIMVIRAEAFGGGAGVLVSLMLLWLSGRRRRPGCRYFADVAPLVLAAAWLILLVGELAGVDVSVLWVVATALWFAVGSLAAAMTLLSVLIPWRVGATAGDAGGRKGFSSAPRPPAAPPTRR